MCNGPSTTYIEVAGKVQKTTMRFADNAQLMNICQRIVSQVGRRVDESSPICDARLPDGSRVNVIAPPLAIDGPALTIRKFKKDRLKLAQLLQYKSISAETKVLLEIIGRVRCNVLISGGTGSGKTTLLNLIAGLDTPTRGEVWVLGRRLSDMNEAAKLALRRETLGFVFQSFGLLPLLTAAENVSVPLRMRSLERREREARRAAVSADAARQIGSVTDREILIGGAIAYWCEGAKNKPHRRTDRVDFINSDPAIIKFFLRFLATAGVSDDRLVFQIHIHETADLVAAFNTWAGENHEEELSAKAMADRLVERRAPVKRVKVAGVRGWCGIGLRGGEEDGRWND
jgi:hypothetical protein